MVTNAAINEASHRAGLKPAWVKWVAWIVMLAFVVVALLAWDDRRKFARYQLAQTRFQEFATVYKLFRRANGLISVLVGPGEHRWAPVERGEWTRWYSDEDESDEGSRLSFIFYDRHDRRRFKVLDPLNIDTATITCWDTNGTETLSTVAFFGHNGELIFQPEGKVRDDSGDMVPIERRSWW